MTDNELLKKVLEHEGCEKVRFISKGTSSLFSRDMFVAYSVPDWMLPWCGVTGEGYSVPDFLNDRNAVAELVVKLKFAQLEQWGKVLSNMRNPTYDYEMVLVAPNIQLRAWWEVVGDE